MATRKQKNMVLCINSHLASSISNKPQRTPTSDREGPRQSSPAQVLLTDDHTPEATSESERKRNVLEGAASILGVSVPSLLDALGASDTASLWREQDRGQWKRPTEIPSNTPPALSTPSSLLGNARQYSPIPPYLLSEGQEGTQHALHKHSWRGNGSGQGAGDVATFPQWLNPDGAVKEVEFRRGFRAEDEIGDFHFDASAMLYPDLDLSGTELVSAQPSHGIDPLVQYPYRDPVQTLNDNMHTGALEPSRQTDRSSPASGLRLDIPEIAISFDRELAEPALVSQLATPVQKNEPGHNGCGDDQETEPIASNDQANLESRKRRRRTKFEDPQKRIQTGQTRKFGSCIRCNMQRVRCELGEGDDPQAPCLKCNNLQGPTLSRLPCLRYRITDASLFAKGNHPRFIWTHRWKSMAIIEIAEWQSADVKEVAITQGVGGACYNIQVREFIPKEGDSLARHWCNYGVSHSYECAPYAIANMHETAQELVQFVNHNVVAAIEYYIDETDQLIRNTYVMAQRYSAIAPTTEERQLLKDVLRLWNAVRMESMSEFICSDETLGMRPQDWDADCNCYGRVLVPPVISAQIQLLMTVKVMQPLKASVLRILKKLVQKNDSKTWFTRYLCIFVLLHSCALLTSHENRRAKKSGFQSRYVTKAFVEELHQGANIMLAFFHYCNKGSRPFAPDFWNSSCHVAMAQLDEEQLNFLRTTSEQIRQKGPHFNIVREDKNFEHDYYFLAQLFDLEWKPTPTI